MGKKIRTSASGFIAGGGCGFVFNAETWKGTLTPLQRATGFRTEAENKRNGEKSSMSRRLKRVKVTLPTVRGLE